MSAKETYGIIISFHTPSNPGYAIGPQESLFYEVGLEATGDPDHVHIAYKNLARGWPSTIPATCKNIIELDLMNSDNGRIEEFCTYIKKRNIKILLGYDAPVKSPYYKKIRQAGIQRIVSHWGAPLSSINKGVKLYMKKLEMALYSSGPDTFVLQSRGMKDSATKGRGIQEHRTRVIPTGIDTVKNSPSHADDNRLFGMFGIPNDRKTIFYSGHFEERKGIRVLVNAAIELVDKRGHKDWHFLLFGNRRNEADRFKEMLKGTEAQHHVTFGGYRDDLHLIRPCCFLGTVATTGWDSFPRSTLEMQASGLPVCVSDLPGLNETVVHGNTGYRFPPGDHMKLVDIYLAVADDQSLYKKLSTNARRRIELAYSRDRQKKDLLKEIMRKP